MTLEKACDKTNMINGGTFRIRYKMNGIEKTVNVTISDVKELQRSWTDYCLREKIDPDTICCIAPDTKLLMNTQPGDIFYLAHDPEHKLYVRADLQFVTKNGYYYVTSLTDGLVLRMDGPTIIIKTKLPFDQRSDP